MSVIKQEYWLLTPTNLNFKIITLSARGIRDQDKRNAIFSWLQKQQTYIIFLKETHNTPEVYSICFCLIYAVPFFFSGNPHIHRLHIWCSMSVILHINIA